MATRNSQPVVLYCAKGFFHPSVLAQASVRSILQGLEDLTLVQTRSIAFQGLIKQLHPQLIVLYFHETNIKQDDLTALCEFVDQGGAVLAIHSASASFKQYSAYQNLLGGKFINHGPIQRYTVEAEGNSFTIKDELYLHEYSAEVNVVMQTESGDRSEPVAWEKNYGKGRIAYFAPGHCAGVFRVPEVQTSIQSLINWSLNIE